MSEQLQLIEIAKYLAELLQVQIKCSPSEPNLIIQALKTLIPQAEQFFNEIEQLPDEQQQWNQIIHFIQKELLQDDMQFGFEKLDTEQIIEVYKVVIQIVEQALEGEENQNQQLEGQKDKSKFENKSQQGRKVISDREQYQEKENQFQNSNIAQQQNAHQHPESASQTGSGDQISNIQQNQSQLKNQKIKQPISNQNSNLNVKANKQSLSYIQNLKKQQEEKNKGKHKEKNLFKQNDKLGQKHKQNPKQKQTKQKVILKKQKQHNKQLKQQKVKENQRQKQKKIKKSSSTFAKPEPQIKNSPTQHKKSDKLRIPNHSHFQSKQLSHKKKARKQQKSNRQSKAQKKQVKSQIRPQTASHFLVSKDQFAKNQIKKAKKSIKKKPQSNQNQNKLHSHKSNIQPKPQPLDLQNEVIKTINEAMIKRKNSKLQKSNLKSNPLMKNNQGLELMQKAKRKYQYQLKNIKHQQRVVNNNQHKSMKDSTSNKDSYLKLLKHKQKAMEKQVLNQQLKYYFKLRDKKLNYIKHMHKLMQKLEKQRQTDLHKKQVSLKKVQKQKINDKIKQADNMFQQNMKQIKQQYKNERVKDLIKNDDEIKIMKQMQKNLNQNKENELNVMKSLWQQERMKLDLIAKDEQNMKKKLEEMYRKNMLG